MIEYDLIRTRRKSVALSVEVSGKVIVKAPIKMSVVNVEQFVQKHTDWIETRLSQVQKTVYLTEMQREELTRRATDELPLRVEYYSGVMGIAPTGIKITSARTRWGSCNYKNSVCFSNRLMLLPQRLIDYVVVHELAHIRVKNHSLEFYKEVEKYMSDYRVRMNELKVIQQSLPY